MEDLKIRTGHLFNTHVNQYKDWVIGSFVKDLDFKSDCFEFKYQKAKKGEKSESKVSLEPNVKTLCILIYGEAILSFEGGTHLIYLRKEGDYAQYEPNEPHQVEFKEDSFILTLRWKI